MGYSEGFFHVRGICVTLIFVSYSLALMYKATRCRSKVLSVSQRGFFQSLLRRAFHSGPRPRGRRRRAAQLSHHGLFPGLWGDVGILRGSLSQKRGVPVRKRKIQSLVGRPSAVTRGSPGQLKQSWVLYSKKKSRLLTFKFVMVWRRHAFHAKGSRRIGQECCGGNGGQQGRQSGGSLSVRRRGPRRGSGSQGTLYKTGKPILLFSHRNFTTVATEMEPRGLWWSPEGYDGDWQPEKKLTSTSPGVERLRREGFQGQRQENLLFDARRRRGQWKLTGSGWLSSWLLPGRPRGSKDRFGWWERAGKMLDLRCLRSAPSRAVLFSLEPRTEVWKGTNKHWGVISIQRVAEVTLCVSLPSSQAEWKEKKGPWGRDQRGGTIRQCEQNPSQALVMSCPWVGERTERRAGSARCKGEGLQGERAVGSDLQRSLGSWQLWSLKAPRYNISTFLLLSLVAWF